MENLRELSLEELESINGGFGWGDAILGLLGGFAKPPTLEQLNGGATKNFKAHSCSPYGQGGTPNSCNF